MKTKKLISMALMLSLVLILSACSGNSNDQKANTTSSNSNLSEDEIKKELEQIFSSDDIVTISTKDLRANFFGLSENESPKLLQLKKGRNLIKEKDLLIGKTLKEIHDWIYSKYDLSNVTTEDNKAYYIVIIVKNNYYSGGIPNDFRENEYGINFNDYDYAVRENDQLHIYSSHEIAKEEVNREIWQKDGNDIFYGDGDVYITGGKLMISGENGGIKIDSLKLPVNDDARLYSDSLIDDVLQTDRYLCINAEGSIFASNNPCNKADKNKEEEENEEELKSCSSDYECAEGYICYRSQYFGLGDDGPVAGEEEGDLKCHKNCENDDDCETGTCQSVDLKQGDLVNTVQFCINTDPPSSGSSSGGGGGSSSGGGGSSSGGGGSSSGGGGGGSSSGGGNSENEEDQDEDAEENDDVKSIEVSLSHNTPSSQLLVTNADNEYISTLSANDLPVGNNSYHVGTFDIVALEEEVDIKNLTVGFNNVDTSNIFGKDVTSDIRAIKKVSLLSYEDELLGNSEINFNDGKARFNDLDFKVDKNSRKMIKVLVDLYEIAPNTVAKPGMTFNTYLSFEEGEFKILKNENELSINEIKINGEEVRTSSGKNMYLASNKVLITKDKRQTTTRLSSSYSRNSNLTALNFSLRAVKDNAKVPSLIAVYPEITFSESSLKSAFSVQLVYGNKVLSNCSSINENQENTYKCIIGDNNLDGTNKVNISQTSSNYSIRLIPANNRTVSIPRNAKITTKLKINTFDLTEGIDNSIMWQDNVDNILIDWIENIDEEKIKTIENTISR